ncbi:hypothetical protein HAHI6034_00870 [Hathewaya histolytica]|uniref:Predicted ATP-grasp enzyme n=1 Tax=Hathewaya histolytica TaxID=1498 RepID=A0A4U9RPR5_HATHI|nr:hypothetical protein [Hathewaya histolytica]VTQ92763.1 Predicted ATP-grasp enzyme [Hathewaya histolytica]
MKYFIHSDYVNAWTVKKGLEKLDKELINTGENDRLLVRREEKIEKGDWIFFTEEKSLKKYVNKGTYKFYPQTLEEKLLDNKYEFGKFLEYIGELAIPYTINEEEVEEFPVFFKCKYSWKNGEKKPRGYIVKTREEINKLKKDLINKGENLEDYFFQKLLKSPPENNISVSGFFDYENNKRNVTIVTKKTLGEEGKIATGCIVETIEDPINLKERTFDILSSMKYKGPFELEFFYEEADDLYYVLELNPRFWMQHGIFVDKYDNALIKRYLNLDTEEDWKKDNVYKKVVWINNLFYFKDKMKSNRERLSIYKEVKNKNKDCVVLFPDNITTIKYYIKSKVKMLFKK